MQPNHTEPIAPVANDPMPPLKRSSSNDGWRSIISTILILIAAPVVAIILTTYVFQSYEVDGPSMEITLQNHDRLIVWKAGRTVSRLDHKDFIPKRGNIVVFNKTGLFESGRDQEKQLIKRVIALPGEHLIVKDGIITIYNAEHPDGFNPDANTDYIKAAVSTTGNIDIIIPKSQIFVCGDNRGNSLDSRYFGPVPVNDVVGTLALRIFPISKAEAF